MKYEITTKKMKVEFDNLNTAFSYSKSLLVHNKWVMIRKVLKNPKKSKLSDDNITFDDIIKA